MIYLDNNATTSLDPRVLEAMMAIFRGHPCNPSSTHRFGQKARGHLEEAAAEVAKSLGGHPSEILFTSGATESLNLAIFGASAKRQKGHILTSNLEHSAVLRPLGQLEKKGFEISYLAPSKGNGMITPEEVRASLRPNTCLIVLMAANNETGVLTDLEGIGAIAEQFEIPLIVDGVAWLGKAPFSLPKGVSAFCFSAHKIHGPMGVGGVFLRKEFKCEPFIFGGPQQNGRRGGTENLPGIVGCAKALQLAKEEMASSISHMEILRDRFEEGIMQVCPDAMIHGKGQPRICNTSNIAFPRFSDGELFSMKLDLAGVASSHGSACSSGALEPSHVLLGMGISKSLARASLRFSCSKFTKQDEIDEALNIIQDLLKGPSENNFLF